MENLESLPEFKANTVTGKEFHDRIYVGGLPPERFLPPEKGGSFHYSPLYSLRPQIIDNVFFSVLEVKGEILGIAELEKSPYEESELWLKSVAVDSEHQGEGWSEPLLREVFKYASEQGKKLKLSKFTVEGEERLGKKIELLAKEFQVEVLPDR